MFFFSPVSLSGLAAELKSGEKKLLDHIHEVCERIDAVEPKISALVPEENRKARLLAEARALLSAYPDPGTRPPLFGALLGVKDLFSVAGFETKAGSRLPPGLFAMPEAPAVTALKQAGCLVLGKTACTEFAYYSPGPTANPWDTGRTPGGSSSGSAAAVAAGFCPLALGTQTMGSISRPAAFCGVSGYKPSYGRAPSAGVVAFSPSLDHVGLFASAAEDMALAAPLIVSNWNRGIFLKPSALPVLAIPEGPYLEQAEAAALSAFYDTVEALRRGGFRIIEAKVFRDIADINGCHQRIAACEFARVHALWFGAYESLYSETTADLIRKGQKIDDAQLELDKAGCLRLRAELEKLLAKTGADYWISPSAPGPAPAGLTATGSPIMNLPWTQAGVPTLSIPSGSSAEGMPLGLQVAANFGHDEELLALVSAISHIKMR
jgi:Asp-tRNA(Asn)/Glu-tRNA(Gln) amidotransferase A subunit family amidase